SMALRGSAFTSRLVLTAWITWRGLRGLPVARAGQASWQRPHSVQVKESSRSFQLKSVTLATPKRLPGRNSSLGWVLGRSRLRKKQLGMAVSTCICLLAGRKQRKASSTTAWSHQQYKAKGSRNEDRGKAESPAATAEETGCQSAAGSRPRAISLPWRPKKASMRRP